MNVAGLFVLYAYNDNSITDVHCQYGVNAIPIANKKNAIWIYGIFIYVKLYCKIHFTHYIQYVKLEL